MYKIGYLGNFEKVPQVVEYILNSDVENLEKELKNGWDINKKITLSEFNRNSFRNSYTMY